MRRNISSLIDFYKTDKIIIYDGAIKTNNYSNPSRQLLQNTNKNNKQKHKQLFHVSTDQATFKDVHRLSEVDDH